VARARKRRGLPSFIVIGAMKGGTSSLHHYLRQHPEVCMSRIKETDFFIEARNYAKGLDWYRSLFADHDKVCGEASPNYTKRHQHRGVPARLRQVIPDAKLIYLLRDPIDRVVSHYLHNRALGREARSLAEAVGAKSCRNNYVRTSMYLYQLSPYLRRFGLERILIVTTEDLKDKRAATLKRIFEFIGVDGHLEGSDYGRLFNQTPVVAPPESQRNDWLPGPPIPEQAADANGRPVLDPGLKDRLVECLTPDLDQLRNATGLRFERWSL
jgi:hypothetical protein